MDTEDGTLVQLRAFIANGEFAPNERLPAERQLCEKLGVTRVELRKAFAVLEADGVIWRHVGRGTFIGNGREGSISASVGNISKRTNPREVMYARLILEPQLAREAAFNATEEDLILLRLTAQKARKAKTWREYETLDNQFHWQIAKSTKNNALVALFDLLNALRRTVAWGRQRARNERPPKDHHSFEQHEKILLAIENREGEQAKKYMHAHLETVLVKLLSS